MARFARQIIINKLKLYLLPARHVRINLLSNWFSIGYGHCLIHITYSPFSQLE